MELNKTVDDLSYDSLQKYISDYKLFLSENVYPKQIYKKNPKQAITVLNYTLYFFEQVQKKTPETFDIETYNTIYSKLYEINELWKSI